MRLRLTILFFVFAHCSIAQNIEYAKQIIDTLCSETMHGRGYVNSGDKIAAEYIANEFKKHNLQHFNNSYFQKFSFPINTIPDTVNLSINGKKLVPGKNFTVGANSKSIEGKFEIIDIRNLKKLQKSITKTVEDKFLIVDKASKEQLKKLKNKPQGMIELSGEKLMWHVSGATSQSELIQLTIDSALIPEKIESFDLKINSTFVPNYNTQNIIGFIEGKVQPDSFIVFSAHYDHLGRMGNEAYFPGANDNASGVAMVLNLAEYFSKEENKPDYSIAFMAFSGEEVGILGSHYYTENPLFPLEKIRFLTNVDMVGTGEEGIKIVNSSVLKEECEILEKINEKNIYLKAIKKRGEAANSDHYFFYKNGVRSYFIYTLGGIAEYHNIYDKAETLPLTEFQDIVNLLIDFTKELSSKKN